MPQQRFGLLGSAIFGLLIGSVTPTLADNSVRNALKIEKGCYPISFDATKDEIGVICRGQRNWTPEGVQYFATFSSDNAYKNLIGTTSSLKWDLENGVGPEPWLKFFFSQLDNKGIPRPK